jgi:acetyl esterase/lipase
MNKITHCLFSAAVFVVLCQPLYAQAPAPTAELSVAPGGAAGMGGGPPPEEPATNAVPSSIQTYKTIGDITLSAHIFNPPGHSAKDMSPALLFFHGGGLRMGTPKQGYGLGELLSAKGVVVLSMQYRLADKPGLTLDAIIADTKSAVRWVRANAKTLGIDPNKIVISGHSAGAYLAATTALFARYDEPSEDAKVSSVPNAMILWSLPVRRTERNSANILPAGATLDDFQPEKFLRGGLPPSTFIHGSVDTIASPQVAQDFQAALKAAGNKTEFHLVEGVDHFFAKPEQRTVAFEFFGKFLSSLGYLKN